MGAEPEPIRIGAIFAETGIAAPHNKPLLEMTRFAVELINENGGVLDRPLALSVYDNKSTPIGSAQAAHQAVEDGLVAVIGAHWSSHSLAMAPILQKAHIPMITPASTNPEVTRVGDYIFRVCFLDSFQGRAMATFARQKLDARSVIILTDIDEEYSITLSRFFRESFTAQGGVVLADSQYRRDATDFSLQLEEIAMKQPDVVYLPGYTRDSGLIIRQAKKLGLNLVFLGGDAWDEIESQAGEAINGSYQTAPWHPGVTFEESETLQEHFIDRYKKTIGNISSPLAYDAVQILAEAIRRAGSTDRTEIRNVLAGIDDFHGATGSIGFNTHGDPETKSIIVLKYVDGRRHFITTVPSQ